MSLFAWLFGSSARSAPRARSSSLKIVGDGSFEYDVVGESFYQPVLDSICGGKSEGGHEHACTAVLVCENDNPYDSNAIAVVISGRKVGHLPRSEAAAFRLLLRRHGIENLPVRCNALVVGGWKRERGDEGHYGVKLDIHEGATLTDQ